MSDMKATREALSALMDGEASEIDLARVLRDVDDPALRADWVRQTRIQQALRGEPAPASLIDVSAGVSAAIAKSPSRRPNPLVGLAVAASVTFAVVFGGQQLLTAQAPSPVSNLPGGVVSVQGGSALQASLGSQRPEAAPARNTVNRVLVSPAAAPASARYEQLAIDQYQRLGIEHAAASANLQPSALVPYARVPEQNR